MDTATPFIPPVDVRLMRLAARSLVGLALAILAVGALAVLGRWDGLAIRDIRIEGDTRHVSAAALRSHALPLLHGNYLSLNLREARAAFEAVPWVQRAEVRRIWPHTLVVKLQEHRPVAFWDREDGDDLLVDGHGEVFEVDLDDLDDDRLPRLRGPQGSAERVLAMWRRLAPEFAPLDLQLRQLALTDGGAWQARLDKAGAVVELGRGEPDEVVRRTRRFVGSVRQITARFGHPAIEYADLRHAESYALRLAGVGTTTDTPKGTPKDGRKPAPPDAPRDTARGTLR